MSSFMFLKPPQQSWLSSFKMATLAPVIPFALIGLLVLCVTGSRRMLLPIVGVAVVGVLAKWLIEQIRFNENDFR